MTKRSTLATLPWWAWVLAIDAILIGVTIAWPHLSTSANFSGKRKILLLLGTLNLAWEMNLAAWWAGMSLLLAGLLCYELFSNYERFNNGVPQIRLAWLPIAFVLGGLSLDEIASIHERVLSNWLTIVLLFVAGMLFLIPAFWRLLREAETRTSALLLLAGLVLMGSAAFQEYLEHNIVWSSSLEGVRVGLEEGSEVIGTFLVLLALVRQRREVSWPNPLSMVVPNPFRMWGVWGLLLGMLAAQVVITLITVEHVEIGYRGNPAVYVPSAVFVVLAAGSFWRAFFDASARIGPHLLYALLFTLASLATFYLLPPGALPQFDSAMWLYCLWAFYLFLGIGQFVLSGARFASKEGGLLMLIVGALAVAIVIEQQAAVYLVAGVVVGALAGMVLRSEHRQLKIKPYA